LKEPNSVVDKLPMFGMLPPATLIRLIPVLHPMAFSVGDVVLRDPDSVSSQEVRKTPVRQQCSVDE
jgi:hypothetical protein